MRLAQTLSVFYVSTLEKEFRNKIFWVVLLMTLLVIVALNSFHDWMVQNLGESPLFESKIAAQLFFSLLLWWGSLLAAIFGVGLLQSDREEGTLPQLLAFPVCRHEYLLARFLGGFSLAFFYHLATVVISGTWLFGNLLPLEKQLLFSFLTVPYLSWMILCGMLFSLFFSRIISLVWLSFFGLVQGWATFMFEGASFGDSSFWSVLARVVYWVFPHGWEWGGEAVDLLFAPTASSNMNWAFESGHFCLSFGLFFAILILIFRHRDV